jgi:hypothetical protein
MRRTIGGVLDAQALARMHFYSLDATEQAAAVRRLLETGLTEQDASAATGLSTEQIRRVLSVDHPTLAAIP